MIKYRFRNKTTKKIIGPFDMTISEAEEYEKTHSDEECVIGAPGFHSGIGLKKPDSGFRDVLKRIKRQNSRGIFKSTIDTY